MNEESILAWNIIEKTSANLFLTGKAGTGKTTFLKQLKEKSPKRMVVLAPTGIAAINAGKAVLTGNKMEQKYYRTHSGWVGGLKETKYRILMQDKPELAMRVAVRGMMPRNIVTKDSLKRLHIYAGEQHDHAAQKPELVK